MFAYCSVLIRRDLGGEDIILRGRARGGEREHTLEDTPTGHRELFNYAQRVRARPRRWTHLEHCELMKSTDMHSIDGKTMTTLTVTCEMDRGNTRLK